MHELRQGTVCSHAQRRFWVLDRLDPGDPALNVAVRWRLEGSVSVATVERAFRLIIARHEVLRSYFEQTDAGEPAQLVAPKIAFNIPFIDLSAAPEAEALAEAERIARMEARASFDLTTPPLIRVTLLQVARKLSYLLVTAHHTVCDGWSIGLLSQEFGEICAAAHAGRIAVLPELPVSYGEFAEWQNLHLSGNAWQHEIDYWTAALQGMSYFEIAADRPRPATQTNASDIVSVLLERSLTEGLERLAHAHESTLFMAALAALFTLLHRYTGDSDIALGTQVAGRDEVEIEQLVGVFINTLILRCNLADNPSFGDLLERVRDLVSGAFEHPHVPLEKLIEVLKPKRELNRNPFFAINFIYQRSFIENCDYGTFRLVDIPSFSSGALYDLNFFMVERPDGWRLSCEYKTDLFEKATVERLLQNLQNVFRGMIAQPAQPIALAPMLGEAESGLLLLELNRTQEHYPLHKTLADMLMEQAARTPDCTALVFEQESLTYAELDESSNRIAHHLRALGVEAEVPVAVCMERSLELLVALCGVLKAGGAYVPLDPAYPPARLAFMLRDSGARVLLTQQALRDRLTEHEAEVVCLDRDWPVIEARPATRVETGPTADNLAYIIYTSGSTGQPKGAMNTHRAVVNRLVWMQEAYRLQPSDSVLQKTPISFDVSVWELFWPLLYGARLVIARPGGHQDPLYLCEVIARCNVTIAHFVPSMLNVFLQCEESGRCLSLRDTICSGEALAADTVNAFLRALPSRLHNLYGPTEAAVDVTAWQCKPLPGGANVPIGKPISNVSLYILDANQQLMPFGAPGELYIGGVAVARGYLNRPELSRERFISSPFVAGERLYRTGDLARYQPDGNIEFLGRRDQQVKLRGLRIELGEIEAALRDCPGVRDAVVVVRTEAAEDARLVGYIVAQDGTQLSTTELKSQLGGRLPDHMIPTACVFLDTLPLNPNGKLDRAALPAPERAAAAAPTRALDEGEKRLAALWSEVLHCEVTDGAANFFELGGHSLLAARLLGRIDAEFGQRLTLAGIFKSPTLAEQADLLRRGSARDFEFRQVIKLQPNGSRPAMVAIHNTGIFFGLCKRLGAEQPFTSLQLFDPSLPGASLPQSVEAIAAGYVDLIRRLQPKGPYILASWCVAGVIAYEVARQLQEGGAEVPLFMIMDTWAPGYLRRLPRRRAVLAEYSYRWKLIAVEWEAVRAGRLSLRQFVSNRVFVKRMLRLFGAAGAGTDGATPSSPRTTGDERYDRWLLQYVEKVARKYEARPARLHVTLFRASQEPGGRFLDRNMGWGDLALDGVTTVMVDGNHFTMFQPPGVEDMAAQITRQVDALARRTG
ncbi:MAG TPA: amino acid adenylation domain-containing protein [Steroidobacteraceae bacterium]|jgi:amino acid adenylation domain-containing protein|nr:amino acid adenylation domain-containing protein [Steroidobacteraceae bacterium]